MTESWFKSTSIIIMPQSLPSHLQTHSAVCISLSAPCFLRFLHKTIPSFPETLYLTYSYSSFESGQIPDPPEDFPVFLLWQAGLWSLLCPPNILCSFSVTVLSILCWNHHCLICLFRCCFLESGNPSYSPLPQQLFRVVLSNVVATS